MRTRTTTYKDIQNALSWKGYDSSSTQQSNYVSYDRDFHKKTIVDQVTENYWTLLRNGDFLPINAVTIETYTQKVEPSGGVTEVSPIGKPPPAQVKYMGSWDPRVIGYPLKPAPTLVSSEVDEAVILALSRAKSPEFDLLTFLGEWKETQALLTHNADRLRSVWNGTAYRAFKREVARARRGKRQYNAQRAMRDLSSLWLEARYGWRPLIGSMEDALKALAKKQQTAIASSSGKVVVSLDDSDSAYHTLVASASSTYVTSFRRTGTATVRAKVYHRSNMSAVGFNPIVSAWELTRLSFVADWFVNAGNWLTAVSPRVGYGHLGTSVSIKMEYTDVYDSVHDGTSGWSDQGRVGLNTIGIITYSRAAYTGIPLPSLTLNLDWAKGIDLAALALTMFTDVGRILKL